MEGFKSYCGIAIVVIVAVWFGLAGLFGLIKPSQNGCIMTYMFPQYIPISTPANMSSGKYGLYLYHEGWQKIDYEEHIKKLNGVPVLFIPGNAGSYKQVRSLAAESERAFQGGPLTRTFYQEASLTVEEGEAAAALAGFQLPSQYTSKLDWFAVDLEGEHSAMDGRIVEEHTEYVVSVIHKILDQYKESRNAQEIEGAALSGSLPESVILVGHSIGGFTARAAVIHPHLRKNAVKTILTLATPHQSPPLALQPSLGHYFARINQQWNEGYQIRTSRSGRHLSDPTLSHVVVVSISAGYSDYQVRSMLGSLDGIVPPTHGFAISSTAVKNVWLSMEHQAILWCNQLVVQVSHTLLSLVEPRTGHPFSETQKRLATFARMLHSPVPQSFNWITQPQSSQKSITSRIEVSRDMIGLKLHNYSACPNNIFWSDDDLDRDLYIQTTTVTVLAMDGRRRWLDIKKLGSDGKSHFTFATNLAPCSGVRLHLWPEKGSVMSDLPISKKVKEVTLKMVQIPYGPAPRQTEPGSQSEQAPPSAIFQLSPEEMQGFRFLAISVAPPPNFSGRPPPAVSMGVGQFFKPEEGEKELSALELLLTPYSSKNIILKESHPLALKFSFGISLGLLPVTLSLKTTSCGVSGLEEEEGGETESNRLCKLRCFPPVALAWETTAGLNIFPNFYSGSIIVDSSPAIWSSAVGSEKTNVLLLVDPHCSYKAIISFSIIESAARFLLLYCPQIVSFSIAVIFFALMHQAHAWDLDMPIPSLLTSIKANLRIPFPFPCLVVVPTLILLFLSLLMSQPIPPFGIFFFVSMICYLLANGFIILLIMVSQLFFYLAATVQVFVKKRWQACETNFCLAFVNKLVSLPSSLLPLKVIRIISVNPLPITTLAAIFLAFIVHPALGLLLHVVSYAFCCHSALCSFLSTSLRNHRQGMDFDQINKVYAGPQQFAVKRDGDRFNEDMDSEDNCTGSPGSRSFGDTQLEIFHHRLGLLVLHILAALMFSPSLVAWLQRVGTGHRLPWFVDSVLCTGVILHGCNLKPQCSSYSIPGMQCLEVRLRLIYLVAGYSCFLSGLALAPYKVFYAMAAVGFIYFGIKILEKRSARGEAYFGRKHSHRH